MYDDQQSNIREVIQINETLIPNTTSSFTSPSNSNNSNSPSNNSPIKSSRPSPLILNQRSNSNFSSNSIKTSTSSSWNVLRKHVLKTNTNNNNNNNNNQNLNNKKNLNQWPVLNRSTGTLHYPPNHPRSINYDNHYSPSIESFGSNNNSRSNTPTPNSSTSRFAKFVGIKSSNHSKGKEVQEQSILEIFMNELEKVKLLFENGNEVNKNIHSTVVGSNSKTKYGSRTAFESLPLRSPIDNAVQALRLLDGILETYKNLGTSPAQSTVLNLLTIPFQNKYVIENEGPDRLSLEIYEKMLELYSPRDAEEELERWIFLLQLVEVDSIDLRNRIIELIETTISTQLHPYFWSTPTSSITIQSLLSSLVQTLYHLSITSISTQIISDQTHYQTSIIHHLITQIAIGKMFTVLDVSQFANTLNLENQFISPLSDSKLFQLITFHSLLLIALSSSIQVTEWIITTGSNLFIKFWPDELWGNLEEQVLLLWSRISYRLLSSSSTSKVELKLSSDQIKTSLSDIISPHYSSTSLPNLTSISRTHLVHAYLSYFITTTSISQVSIHELSAINSAKKLINEVWKLDKNSVIEAVKKVIIEVNLNQVVGILSYCLLNIDDKVNKGLASHCIPVLFDRLNSTTSFSDSSTIPTLLHLLSERHPIIFFKHLFTLTSPNSTTTLTTCLATLHTLKKIMGSTQYLFKDAEMMVVILLADLNNSSNVSNVEDSLVNEPEEGFGKIRIGQLVLFTEMILAIKNIRENMEISKVIRNEAQLFGETFESRFSVFLLHKEQTALIPFSERILIVNLLFELRMLGKPLNRPIWLPRIIEWSRSSSIGQLTSLEIKKGSLKLVPDSIRITQKCLSEVAESKYLLLRLYEGLSAQLPSNKLQTTHFRTTIDVSEEIAFISKISTSPLASILSLLVAVHTFLSREDLNQICSLLWNLLDTKDITSLSLISYLLTLCASTIPESLDKLISSDISNSLPLIRQSVLNRLMALFSSRFDIAVQDSADRSQKLPFNIGLEQLSFIPIHVGSSTYVTEEIREETKFELGGSLPAEVRRALADLGWNEKTGEQTQNERQRLPLSLLSWNELALDNLSELPSPSNSRSNSPEPLSRRRSNGKSSIVGKRKAVVTAEIAKIFLKMIDLLQDKDMGVALSSKESLIILLRDDPSVLLRPLLINLTGTLKEQQFAVNQLYQLSHLQRNLPFGATHHIFNHLAGLIKALSRDSTSIIDPLSTSAILLPITTAFAPLVSDFSIRDLRKNKVDNLFVSTSTFWYTSEFPDTLNFPRRLLEIESKPFQHLSINSNLFNMAMIRIAQNNLTSSLLKISTKDAYAIKKFHGQLFIPSIDHLPTILGPQYFLPSEVSSSTRKSRSQQASLALSVLVARSWLLALFETLNGLSRNFSAKEELALLFDGVSRILLVHGNDCNIVGLSLRIYMMASSRFRRLFSSNNGFSLIISTLFKVFIDSKFDETIRSSILYSFQRFFRAHEESFVFQLIGNLAPLFMIESLDERKSKLMAENLFQLLEALQMNSIDVADIAGIRGANEKEERESLIHQANARPEIFLVNFDQSGTTAKARLGLALGESKPFTIASVIKLFFTVIAFDPTSKRATEFSSVFRLLIPHLYQTSEFAALLIQEGMKALSLVYNKTSTPSKTRNLHKSDTSRAKSQERTSIDIEREQRSELNTISNTSLKKSYLGLVEAYQSSGGKFESSTVKNILELVQSILKDSSSIDHEICSTFISNYSTSIIGINSSPTSITVVSFLNEISPFLRHYFYDINFTLFFQELSRLHSDNTLQKDSAFLKKVSNIASLVVQACSTLSDPEWYKSTSLPAAIHFVATWLSNIDILEYISRQSVAPLFLSSFLFPLVLEFSRIGKSEYEDDISKEKTTETWLKLIGIIFKSLASKLLTGRAESASLVFSFQILKISILLGEANLTKSKAWSKFAQLIGTYLKDGNIHFISNGKNLSPGGLKNNQLRSIDYVLFSFIEFISLTSSPLLLHLRPLIQDKIIHSTSLNSFNSQNQLQENNNSPFLRHENFSRSTQATKSLLELYAERHSSTFSQPNVKNSKLLPASPQFNYVPISHYEISTSQTSSNFIKSSSLISVTLKRVRILQILSGCVPSRTSLVSEVVNELDLKSWTKIEAIKNVVEEMRELEIEFKDVLGLNVI